MKLFNNSFRRVLSVLEKSTDIPHWGAELERETGLSKPTVINVLTTLERVGFINTRGVSSSARLYCELTSHGLATIRLTGPSE